MLKMSFYDNTLDKAIVREFVEHTDKAIMYRYGFEWRGAGKQKISKEKALKIIEEESWLDVDEYKDELVLNEYSSNDMF